MSDFQLTQDADYLLCVLYETYIMRRREGKSISDAAMFWNAESIQRDLCPSWPTTDISAAAYELKEYGMLAGTFGDNELDDCDLLPSGIAYMEQRFGRKLDQLVNRIAALRAAVLP